MSSLETPDDIARGLEALVVLDPRLRDVVAAAGPVPLRRRAPTLANLMKIVISQQVSVASASAIWTRFEAAFPDDSVSRVHLAGDDALGAVGLSRPKAKTLRALAAATADGRLDCSALVGLPTSEVRAQLIALHGIGPWTAEIFALFCLGDPDIFPLGDIALQQAIADALSLPARPTGVALEAIIAAWVPFRGVAAHLFWAYYAQTRKNRAVLPV